MTDDLTDAEKRQRLAAKYETTQLRIEERAHEQIARTQYYQRRLDELSAGQPIEPEFAGRLREQHGRLLDDLHEDLRKAHQDIGKHLDLLTSYRNQGDSANYADMLAQISHNQDLRLHTLATLNRLLVAAGLPVRDVAQ